MTIAKQMDIRANIKEYFDRAFNGDTILVPRKENKNVVIISQAEYEELQKAKRNAEYLAILDESMKQILQGKTVVKSLKELEDMQSE